MKRWLLIDVSEGGAFLVSGTQNKTEKGKNTMDFETFRDSLAEDVREKLEGKTGEKYSVEVYTIER